jgi:hypothetical protein
MKDIEQRHAEIRTEFGDLLLYRGSEQMRNLIRLYDALIADHMAELISVKPENLLFRQGQIAQLITLRDAIISPDRIGILS